MGKDKKYYIISGLNLNDNNRGTAALSYGAFVFLNTHYKKDQPVFIHLVVYKKPWKYKDGGKKEMISINEKEKIVLQHIYIWLIDYWIYKYIPFFSRFTKMARTLKTVSFVAAINGGDGFSDIYGTKSFECILFETNLALREQIPLIMLPQTLGPFKDKLNLGVAEKILKYASKVYIRDLKFEPELKRMNIFFELTKDLSYYMNPEKFDIEIKPHAVGLNVSGLCYSNKFRDLSGRFDNYPQLIDNIIKYFQEKNIPVYLVSHSYNYHNPEFSNDDIQASRDVYDKLNNKTNIYLIDRDLTSPRTKYVISQFDFFIGTRMHANFAALYTGVPVFALAYSYKFEGAFNIHGLRESYALILDLKKDVIPVVMSQIIKCYDERNTIRQRMIK